MPAAPGLPPSPPFPASAVCMNVIGPLVDPSRALFNEASAPFPPAPPARPAPPLPEFAVPYTFTASPLLELPLIVPSSAVPPLPPAPFGSPPAPPAPPTELALAVTKLLIEGVPVPSAMAEAEATPPAPPVPPGPRAPLGSVFPPLPPTPPAPPVAVAVSAMTPGTKVVFSAVATPVPPIPPVEPICRASPKPPAPPTPPVAVAVLEMSVLVALLQLNRPFRPSCLSRRLFPEFPFQYP